MKKIVASVGLFAFGASGVHAASPAAMTAEAAKPWSVSATLRGFYDDNVGTAPDSASKVESFGFEVSPSFALNWALEQTTMSFGYVYSLKYYEKRPPGNADNYDQTHTFNALLNHAFSQRYVLNVQDSFVIGQEPDLLRAGRTFSTFQRVPGDNIRNYGQIQFNAELTRVFGLELGYQNSFFHYEDTGFNTTFLTPSLAGLLDRIEHAFHIDGRWLLQPQTTAVVGYRYSQVDYTADELIGFDSSNGLPYFSDDRNSRSHYGYLGVDHSFRPDLIGKVRVGARYTEYYNQFDDPTQISPYAQASLQYFYNPDSYLMLDVTHDRNATDLFSAANGSLTSDAESTSVAASVHHRILPSLYGSIMGEYQFSSINGGPLDNTDERYYLVGLNLEYRFNPHISAHLGYNYDKLDSDNGRTFDRNRVYMGVTASY